MALIKCPECGNEVSSSAESCPKCAYPMIRNDVSTSTHSGDVQTKEKSSERYKLQRLLSGLIVILSFVGLLLAGWGLTHQKGLFIYGGVLGVVVGGVWHITVRFMAWRRR